MARHANLTFTTPLGADAFYVRRLEGNEAVSKPYRFQLELLAGNQTAIPFDEILGRSVSIAMTYPGLPERNIHGIVSSFQQIERSAEFTQYQAEVVPPFWRLKRRVQSRIFQRKTVGEILRIVLKGLEVEYRLSHDYQRHNYCVQYRESDFNFANRLMEEEGLYYYFEFAANATKMIVADDSRIARPLSDPAEIAFDQAAGGARAAGRISRWTKKQSTRSTSYSLRDYSHELPHDMLETANTGLSKVRVGEVSHRLGSEADKDLFIADYPGEYAHRFDAVGPGGADLSAEFHAVFDQRSRTAQLRMEAESARTLLIEGKSDLPHFAPGQLLRLSGHFDGDGQYFLTAVEHKATNAPPRADKGGGAGEYGNSFRCLPAELPFRPARRTKQPRVAGTQTATVVGPKDETIFTDKVGRVKVQFHWDREGKSDLDSSCWVRVAQQWAGKGFGFHTIPRVGQEVIVDFLEGDPDRPIVVGSLFNAVNLPPQTMPAHKTRTYLKSQSVSHSSDNPAGADNCHGLLIDDAMGGELLHLHSERTRSDSTEGHHYVNVGGNHHTNVGGASVRQVGGLRGSDHSKGPGAPNPKRRRPVRTAPPVGSGTGRGDDVAGLTGMAAGEWGTKLEMTVGLDSAATLGNSVEFTLGSSCEFVLNPAGLINVLTENPFLGLVLNIGEGIAQSYLESDMSSSVSDGSSSRVWQNVIPGAGTAGSRAGTNAAARRARHQYEEAKKAYKKDYDDAKEAQKKLDEARQKYREAEEEAKGAGEKIKNIDSEVSKLDAEKAGPPAPSKLREAEIDAEIDKLTKEKGELNKSVEEKEDSAKKLVDAENARTKARDDLREAADNKAKAAKTAEETAKQSGKAAEQKKEEYDKKVEETKKLEAERDALHNTEIPKADAALKSAQAKLDAATAAKPPDPNKIAKLTRDRDACQTELDGLKNKETDLNTKEIPKAKADEQTAKTDYEHADQKAAADHTDAHTKSNEAKEAADKQKSDAAGEHDGHSGAEGEAEAPGAGDFLMVGAGRTEITIGAFTEILYGQKFEITRGPHMTIVETPFNQTPTVCKLWMFLMSAYEVSTSVLQSFQSTSSSYSEAIDNEDAIIRANMYEVSIPNLLLQVWAAIEYSYPIKTDGANSAAQVTKNATNLANNAVLAPSTLTKTQAAKQWIAKNIAYLFWIIEIASTGYEVYESVEQISSNESGSNSDSNSDSGSGNGSGPALYPPASSGSGGAGFAEGLVADTAPKVLDYANGLVFNANNVQINTYPNLDSLGPSIISLNATGGDEDPGVVNIYASGTSVLQGGLMAFVQVSTSDAETGTVYISCGEDGILTLGNGCEPTNSLVISAESNVLTAGENILTHNEDGFMFEVGDTEVAFTEEGIEISIGASSITMSDDSITLEAGGATLILSSEGITFEGPVIEMTAEGAVNIDADAVAIEATDISLSGAAVEIDAAAISLA